MHSVVDIALMTGVKADLQNEQSKHLIITDLIVTTRI